MVRGPTNLGHFPLKLMHKSQTPWWWLSCSLLMVLCHPQAYQRLQIQQQMLQAQRNVSGPMRQQEQQVGAPGRQSPVAGHPSPDLVTLSLMMALTCSLPFGKPPGSPGLGRRWAQAPPTPSPADRMPLPAPIPQVARTITNLQQQIQQHQRQLAQALLVKPPPPPPLSLHPSAGKSALDSFPPHPQASGLPELQTKEQQSSPSTFAPYPLGKLGRVPTVRRSSRIRARLSQGSFQGRGSLSTQSTGSVGPRGVFSIKFLKIFPAGAPG